MTGLVRYPVLVFHLGLDLSLFISQSNWRRRGTTVGWRIIIQSSKLFFLLNSLLTSWDQRISFRISSDQTLSRWSIESDHSGSCVLIALTFSTTSYCQQLVVSPVFVRFYKEIFDRSDVFKWNYIQLNSELRKRKNESPIHCHICRIVAMRVCCFLILAPYHGGGVLKGRFPDNKNGIFGFSVVNYPRRHWDFERVLPTVSQQNFDKIQWKNDVQNRKK